MSKASVKPYRCSQCGYISKQLTNTYAEQAWSVGHINCCPECPPHAKYPEFGGRTIWMSVLQKFTVVKCTSGVPWSPEIVWAENHTGAALLGATRMGIVKKGSARYCSAPVGDRTSVMTIHDIDGTKVGLVEVTKELTNG